MAPGLKVRARQKFLRSDYVMNKKQCFPLTTVSSMREEILKLRNERNQYQTLYWNVCKQSKNIQFNLRKTQLECTKLQERCTKLERSKQLVKQSRKRQNEIECSICGPPAKKKLYEGQLSEVKNCFE